MEFLNLKYIFRNAATSSGYAFFVFILCVLLGFSQKPAQDHKIINVYFKDIKFYTSYSAENNTSSGSKSYMLDNTNQNTSFKLAAIYLIKEDCKNAVYYSERCKSLGGQPLSKEFVNALKAKCKF